MSKKYSRYQDYVIKEGKLVGEFDEMYKDFDDPWHQSTREVFASEKAVGLNLLQHLKHKFNIKKVVELGCGFGDYSARIAEMGIDTIGIDISPTAIQKAISKHTSLAKGSRKLEFLVSEFASFDKLRELNPDVILMPEITWYVLDQLVDFRSFLRDELPDTFLIHMLMTYDPGVQVYGKEYFTTLPEILKFFNMHYLESGLVNVSTGGARTWFLGTWNKNLLDTWNGD
jgi:SAM-dependent methyltransferase